MAARTKDVSHRRLDLNLDQGKSSTALTNFLQLRVPRPVPASQPASLRHSANRAPPLQASRIARSCITLCPRRRRRIRHRLRRDRGQEIDRARHGPRRAGRGRLILLHGRSSAGLEAHLHVANRVIPGLAVIERHQQHVGAEGHRNSTESPVAGVLRRCDFDAGAY